MANNMDRSQASAQREPKLKEYYFSSSSYAAGLSDKDVKTSSLSNLLARVAAAQSSAGQTGECVPTCCCYTFTGRPLTTMRQHHVGASGRTLAAQHQPTDDLDEHLGTLSMLSDKLKQAGSDTLDEGHAGFGTHTSRSAQPRGSSKSSTSGAPHQQALTDLSARLAAARAVLEGALISDDD
jgi:hypothetical protein